MVAGSQSAQSPSGDCNLSVVPGQGRRYRRFPSQSAQSPSGDCNCHASLYPRRIARWTSVAISPIPFGGLQRARLRVGHHDASFLSQSAQSPSGDCNKLAKRCVSKHSSASVAISPIPFGGIATKKRGPGPIGPRPRNCRNQPNPLQGIATPRCTCPGTACRRFLSQSAKSPSGDCNGCSDRVSGLAPGTRSRRNQPNPLQGIATVLVLGLVSSLGLDRRNRPNPLQGIATRHAHAGSVPAHARVAISPIPFRGLQRCLTCNLQEPTVQLVAISPIPFRGLQR